MTWKAECSINRASPFPTLPSFRYLFSPRSNRTWTIVQESLRAIKFAILEIDYWKYSGGKNVARLTIKVIFDSSRDLIEIRLRSREIEQRNEDSN